MTTLESIEDYLQEESVRASALRISSLLRETLNTCSDGSVNIVEMIAGVLTFTGTACEYAMKQGEIEKTATLLMASRLMAGLVKKAEPGEDIANGQPRESN